MTSPQKLLLFVAAVYNILLIPRSLQLSDSIKLISVLTNGSCDTKLLNWGTAQLRHPKPGLARFTGTVDLLQDVGARYTLITELLSAKGNKLQVIDQDACVYMRDEHKTWSVDVQPQRTVCPIPKGRYLIKDLIIPEHIFFRVANNYTLDVQLRRGMTTVCRAVVKMSYQPVVPAKS